MPPKHRRSPGAASEALVGVAPLVSRWIERLLASRDPPLTLPQFLALRAIAVEQVSGSELARRTGVSGPAVSQLLTGLVVAGLLERSELPEDRRRHALTLSPRGKSTLRAAQDHVRDRLGAMLAGLPAPELDAVARALPQVEAMLSGAPPPRRPPPPGPPERARRGRGHGPVSR